MKIKSIKIKGFRGFNVEREINLDARVVLIYGLNGSGKSSLAEALEWLFFNEISRRRLSPCPGEYSAGIYLRNLSYSDVQKPFVEVVVCDDLGKDICIRKELVTEKESRSFVDGKEVVDFTSALPGLKNYHSPILAQIEISALVNTEQKDRWEQVSRILGQEELTMLRSRIMELRSIKKDAEYKRDEQLFNGICREIEAGGLLSEFAAAFEQQDLTMLQKIVEESMVDVSLGLAGPVEEKIRAIISKLSGTELGKRITDLTAVDQAKAEVTLANLRERFDQLVELAQKSSQGRYSPDEASFLRGGLKLAHVPRCPLCIQDTLTQARIDDISQALEVDKESFLSKQSFDQALQDNEINFHLLSGRLSQTIPDVKELKAISQKLGEVNLNELSGKVKQLIDDAEEKLNELPAQLRLLYGGLCHAIEDNYFKKIETNTTSSLEAVNGYVDGMGIALGNINIQWQLLRDKILLQFPKVTADQQESEIKKWILVERSNSFLRNKTKFLRKYRLIEVVTEDVRKKLEVFEKAEVESLLAEHSKEIKTYYEKLNPGDSIRFEKIEVRDGVRRQAKLVAYDVNGKEINPVTIFSEAHINSLSLSIYFPQRVDRNPLWKTILLDDPVQSMDDNHAHSLIDILSEKSKEKQVIVLTHSKKFADDMAAIFFYDDLLHYEFFDADISGPKININHGKTLECLKFVESNRNGSEIEREQAANALRKAVEAVIGEILLINSRTVAQVREIAKQGFPKLFDQLERIQNIDLTDMGKLRGMLNDGHQGSHSWAVRDITPNGLLQGSQNIRAVYDKYVGGKIAAA
ncbi:MAG: AAA family ATPase [Patescibacteria group bacterium]|jgi:energy-coupling factor transporter ATP-binding protein EcfA2